MMNKIAKIAAITGLTTLTAMSSLGLGAINVLADDAQLPAYVMDGTNTERAISDYFVNRLDKVNENSVVIPHMDIMKVQDNGSKVDVYGSYEVVEYTKDGVTLQENGAAFESAGRFTLVKNADGTYTVESYAEIPDNAEKADFEDIFGTKLADEAFKIYCNGGGTELWNAVYAQDAGYYAYDNNLGLERIVERDDTTIDLADVSFSVNNARTMYAQTDANVRSAGTKEASVIDGIEKGQDIKVTGIANGWGRVTMDGRTGYVSTSLLDDTKPAKEEKEAEKKEEKTVDIKTGYICGKIEDYSGSYVTVNGLTATLSSDTNRTGGEIEIGKQAKLEYQQINGEQIVATGLYVWEEQPAEGVVIAPDGRVVDTGDHNGLVESEEETSEGVVQAADGRVVDMGDHNGLVESEEETSEEETSEGVVQAADGRVVYMGGYNDEGSNEEAAETEVYDEMV